MRDYNVNYLRSRIAVVDQRPVVFVTSVRDNITYGLHHDVTDQDVIDVLHAASLWEGDNGIKNKPDQILTKFGSGGIALSGGQTQRLSIARVLVRNPDVILLDEATSALDNKNEKIAQAALDKLARRGFALVIAHRMTTIKDADNIVVMRKGKVAEQGTHDELLRVPNERELTEDGEQDVVHGIYRFLLELQFHTEDIDEVPAISETLSALEKGIELETPVSPSVSTLKGGWAKARGAKGKIATHAALQSLMGKAKLKFMELLQDSTCIVPKGAPPYLDLFRAYSAPA
ncbi:unnamed protein product [Polarella glacialis]|uniref:ABC transporter domain-containing protein n=1 Tax=Polarella glacialis TaxID=89957 RepID=A0A813GKL5_POLGL|nr:unnamed protein product [Polarella glacialis]